MNFAARRRVPRSSPIIEALEVRTLLANAGALDPTFGRQGSMSLPIEGLANFLSARGNGNLAAQAPGGKIVVAGSSLSSSGFPIERLDADGFLDPTFGNDGVITTSQDISTIGKAQALAVQPDGSILVAGPLFGVGGSFLYGVARYKPDGSLDFSFGRSSGNFGTALLPFFSMDDTPIESISGLALTSDGHIVVTGVRQDNSSPQSTTTEIFATRFSSTGELDTNFGAGLQITVPITVNGSSNALPSTVAVQPSGRIVIAGEVETTGTSITDPTAMFGPVVVGLTASGMPDPTFGPAGSGGVVILPASLDGIRNSPTTSFDDMVLKADGSILLEVTQLDATSDHAGNLVGLTADGVLDSTFGTGGVVPIALPLAPEGLAIEPDGKIVLPGEVAETNPYTKGRVFESFAAGRFNADGTPDATFGQPAHPGLEVYPTITEYSALDNAFFDGAGHIILTGTSFQTDSQSRIVSGTVPLFRANVSASVTRAVDEPPADLAGTGQTDLAVYLPGPSVYAYVPATGGVSQFVPFGASGTGQTIPAVADYDGLGHAQIADYLPASGTYQVQATAGHPGVSLKFGQAGAGQSIPAPGDYYGTGQDDIAVFLTGPAVFAIKDPTGRTPGELVQLGIGGAGQSIPVPADYYGTGQSDIAVYLPQYAAFVIKDPTGKTPGEVVPFGKPGLGQSIPVPGDYDGSGKVELAVYIPSAGVFIYRPADGGPDVTVPFGFANDGEIPVPGDYDGSGHDEVAVYDETRGFLAYRPANGGRDVVFTIGKPNDGTVAAAASPGSQPEFTGSGGPRAAAIGPDLAASGSTAPPSTVASKAAVPSGPLPSLARVARSLVNQGIEDPSPSAN